MTQGFQRFTKRYVNVLGVLIGLTVVSSILFYSGCGMISRPNIRTNPTPDTTPPTSAITFPTEGAIITGVPPIAITGTASDPGGGSVVKVEVSVDGGANYSAATGTTAWSFNWTPSALGPVTIKSRAVDNTGNLQNPPAEIHITKAPAIFRVPSDRPTIQSAINDAIDGDTVLVAPGTYPENINFKGKAITVTSESGPQVTIIDGGSGAFRFAPVVRFISGEGRGSVINGFTLQNGRDTINVPVGIDKGGGGIQVRESSPTMTNNVIKNNVACGGGGIGISGGSPLIRLNTITGNIGHRCDGTGTALGGGISVSGTSSVKSLDVEILDNVISDNRVDGGGGGIALSGAGTSIVKNNIIKGNFADMFLVERLPPLALARGGGIRIENVSNALIVQNLITGNHANDGGGLYLSRSGLTVVNNTIADNNANNFPDSSIHADEFVAPTELTNNIIVPKPGQFGLYCGGFNDQNAPIIRSNNIFSGGGFAYGGACPDMTGTNGNISADPLFINPTQGDYHLQQASPSIDAGDNQAPNLPDTDLDGNPRILDGDGDGNAVVDMGVYEFLLPPGSVWNFIPRRPRSFTVKIPVGVGSPNTLSSISWAIPFNIGGRRIVEGSSLWASYRR